MRLTIFDVTENDCHAGSLSLIIQLYVHVNTVINKDILLYQQKQFYLSISRTSQFGVFKYMRCRRIRIVKAVHIIIKLDISESHIWSI